MYFFLVLIFFSLLYFSAISTVVNNVAIEEPMEEEWTYDPNEPRYCICNQVSYGHMVACDNQDVSCVFLLSRTYIILNKLRIMIYFIKLPLSYNYK